MDKATETVQSWSKEKRETMNLSKEQEPAYDRLHNICRNVGMGFKEATELLNQLVLGTYNENNKLRAELEKAKKATNQQAINALKLTYRKHCLADDSIGWIELEDILRDALCEAIGDKAFQDFLGEVED
jgi:hypothetical protein